MFYPKKGEAFYVLLYIFRIHMYYPEQNANLKVLRFVQWLLIRGLTIFNFIGIIVHLTISLKNGSYPVIIQDLALGLGYTSIFIGLLLFRRDHKLWGVFLRDLTDFNKFQKPTNYDAMVKFFNMLSLAGALYALAGTYLYVRLPIANHKPCQKINELYGLNEICGLAYPFWWPNELAPKQKWIICTFQIISLALSSIPAMQVILLPFVVVEVMKTRVDHFCGILLSVFDDNSDEGELKKRINYCIEYHQYLIKLGGTLNYLFFKHFASTTAAASVVIALILTQLLQVYNLGNIAHVSAWIGGLFVIHRAGQRLEDMFLAISDTTYFTNWYQTTISNRKTILILMMRTQKPIFLKGLPTGKHNLEMFIALAKTTYSYLTLITQYK